ncbi:restriction endonuclease subunit S [Acinetobacter sichuanensis]|uniref:restriction endonuclease subunit S n=1 Tax=Acinetobacter sichuanensis TaxID=2136183 RepID=UPI00280E2067|nr:restriction endonuclease subunit S [Acinetobacter sichuanensis]MDQ9019576.1 restriction endonuclease subunit S [Acinetobacter sichuanensis]
MCDKKLGEIIEITSGYAFSSDFFDQSQGIPLVRIRDIANEKTEVRYTGPYSNEYVLKNGDLVVGMDGDFNIFRWKGGTALLNQRVCKIEPANRNDLDKSFLYWYLQPHLEKIHAITPQTTVKHLSVKDIVGIDWIGLSLEEQKRIGVGLDLLEENIKLTLLTIEKLNNKKAGLLNDLLNRGVDSQGNIRPSYDDAPDLYQETEMGFIPKEWEICGLHDIQRSDKPVLKTGPFGSALKSEHWRESGHPVITIGSLGVNSIVESELLYIDDLTFNGLSSYLVEGGDIIFSRVADVGRCLIVQDHHKDWVMSSNLMRISVDNKIFKPELLTFILSSSSSLRKQIRKLVNSAGRDVANGEVLMKLKFAKPPVEEQVKIINIVERMNMAIDQELEQLNKLSNIKKDLLKDLLQN